jgi:hypothetical protein
MLDINWGNNTRMQEMQNQFNSIGQDALYMSHYELAKESSFNATDWKDFITEPHVADYITQELRILKQVELSKVLKNISSNAKSVGTAQLLSALTRALEGEQVKSGPAFIYCYIPLTQNEMAAPNVRILPNDPFRRD